MMNSAYMSACLEQISVAHMHVHTWECMGKDCLAGEPCSLPLIHVHRDKSHNEPHSTRLSNGLMTLDTLMERYNYVLDDKNVA